MEYRQCGHSGVFLPAISLGLWHNFGSIDDYENARAILLTAFEEGICHFDLANNYGPVPGSAEQTFGRIFREDLRDHRDEIFVSSKAGHEMWPGVYGNNSSRKNLIASCNASLRRTGLDYFDVFYSHRYDGVTPIEETMQALIDIVRSGKALYAGISKYPPERQAEAYRILREAGVPCLVSQYRGSILDTVAIKDNFPVASAAGSGIACFSPLAQGLLTDRYLNGIPADSRAAKVSGYLKMTDVTPERLEIVSSLNRLAMDRGESLAAMAIAWLLNDRRITSVIVGASSPSQLRGSLKALSSEPFTTGELDKIKSIAKI